MRRATAWAWSSSSQRAKGIISRRTRSCCSSSSRGNSRRQVLRIESTDCIPGYPDGNLPTLLIYRDDELLRAMHRAERVGRQEL